MRRFPYAVHFLVEGEAVVVFAVLISGRIAACSASAGDAHMPLQSSVWAAPMTAPKEPVESVGWCSGKNAKAPPYKKLGEQKN